MFRLRHKKAFVKNDIYFPLFKIFILVQKGTFQMPFIPVIKIVQFRKENGLPARLGSKPESNPGPLGTVFRPTVGKKW